MRVQGVSNKEEEVVVVVREALNLEADILSSRVCPCPARATCATASAASSGPPPAPDNQRKCDTVQCSTEAKIRHSDDLLHEAVAVHD